MFIVRLNQKPICKWIQTIQGKNGIKISRSNEGKNKSWDRKMQRCVFYVYLEDNLLVICVNGDSLVIWSFGHFGSIRFDSLTNLLNRILFRFTWSSHTIFLFLRTDCAVLHFHCVNVNCCPKKEIDGWMGERTDGRTDGPMLIKRLTHLAIRSWMSLASDFTNRARKWKREWRQWQIEIHSHEIGGPLKGL